MRWGDAAGVSIEQLVRAIYNPELLLILARYQGTRGEHGQDARATQPIIPPTCCSSFAAWGGATRDGEMLLGHNLDIR